MGPEICLEEMMKRGSAGQAGAAEGKSSKRLVDGGALEMASASTCTKRLSMTEKTEKAEKAMPAERPPNFGCVVPSVYRSSHPRPEHYQFVKSLALKTVISLVQPEDLDSRFKEFTRANKIGHHVISMAGTKKQSIPLTTMQYLISIVADRQNYPLLIHCNHGRHRTGCVVAVLRKCDGWHVADIVHEYKTYADPKARDCDMEYISSFEPKQLKLPAGAAAAEGQNVLDRVRPVVPRPRGLRKGLVFAVLVLLIWYLSYEQLKTAEQYRRITRN